MADDKYLVLARKWRPQTFEDVVGQEHITRSIQNAIGAGRVGHAFLFIGSRGIGKTTTARVLAKALNCEASDGPTTAPCGACSNCRSIAMGNNIDVIEIDGASNNSVDDVRQIREHIRLVPSRSRFKIYVIDEVHQLSASAFNALLKTLEEPPEHAVFILATTEAHKVPATIISRCQRYDFRRVGIAGITTLLRRILDSEGIHCEDEALHAIARAADGSIRDSESILEQLISYCGDRITFQDVFDVLGLVDWQVLHRLCEAILDQDVAQLLQIVDDIVVNGKDLSQFVQDVLHYLRNLLVCKTAEPAQLLALPDDEIAELSAHADRFSLTGLIRLIEQFADLAQDFDSRLAQRIALESLLIRITKVAVDVSLDSVLEKLVQLGAGGVGPAPQGEVRRSLGAAAAAAVAEPPAPARAASPKASEKKAPGPKEARPKERIALTEQNAARHWDALVVAGAAGHSLNLGIALGHGVPVAIEDGTVTVEFASDRAQSMAQVEAPENRAAIEAVLGDTTTNVTTFRTVANGATSESAPETVPGAASDEDTEAALADPRVARVVDVFKGEVVDIHRKRAHDEAASGDEEAPPDGDASDDA
ncbi:MAG: DNA polymerase III subunit gamma/tau [Candidatus Hydrogenedentes bacterium]|nr:DNA polymerase III subunit gamma/tau [Candidatus Hydrogenedentota bacterium]